MLAGMAAGISGFITDLLAIVKQKENALLVYVYTEIGGLLTLFLIGELAFPHWGCLWQEGFPIWFTSPNPRCTRQPVTMAIKNDVY